MLRFNLLVVFMLLFLVPPSPSSGIDDQNFFILSPTGSHTLKVGVQNDGTEIKVVESQTMKPVTAWKVNDISASMVKI
ncbi:MAG: hypothetical protein GY786_23200 [Proteobacteria bacterium]|nr:hypothetical protein [Pseudomonadota bacterium]